MKPQWKLSIHSGEPAAEPDLSMLPNVMPVEPVSCNPFQQTPTNFQLAIGLRQRDGNGSSICGRITVQTVIFDFPSQWKASWLPVLLPVSFFLILVFQLWDMMIRLCMCEGRTYNMNVLLSKFGCKMAYTFGFFLQATVKWQIKSNISDEMC